MRHKNQWKLRTSSHSCSTNSTVGLLVVQNSCMMLFSFSTSDLIIMQRDAARTWNMLQSWMEIDIKELVGSNINSPTDALYMPSTWHVMIIAPLDNSDFSLDKDAVSHFHDDLLLLMPMHSSIQMFLINTGCRWLEMDTGWPIDKFQQMLSFKP